MIPDVTVVVTSCGRHDLLERTLESFFRCNTDRGIQEVIVVEDGGGDPYPVCAKYHIKLIRVHDRLGQIGAIDLGYRYVTTPYIFHCEDDWEFYRPGFIEASRQILAVDPSTLCVWLRAWDDTNGHPLEFRAVDDSFATVQRDYLGWHGFTFNPGLRRLSDYQRIGPYANYAGFDGTPSAEAAIGRRYHELGYRAVVLHREGYVRHIGWERHVTIHHG